MALVEVIATAVWAMLPAYVPNNVAVVAGGGRPIDGGRTWRGARLLGDGKTWRGLAVGTLAGLLLAGLLSFAAPAVGATLGLDLPRFRAGAALGLPLGAMLGDVVGSLVKRRTGRERGAPFPVLDQLDFVVGALVFAFVGSPAWFRATFTPAVLAAVLVLTPLLHVLTNAIGYALGLKDEPW
ncbi:MAG: CDP-2,3-bis-(O-geranylgeranyl)-sn-glycerol synthase [Halobacteriales archaeon]